MRLAVGFHLDGRLRHPRSETIRPPGSAIRHLADSFVLEFRRVSLMAHGTPPTGSMLASEVSTISGEVQEED